MLTAKNSPSDKVSGLEIGADDCQQFLHIKGFRYIIICTDFQAAYLI